MTQQQGDTELIMRSAMPGEGGGGGGKACVRTTNRMIPAIVLSAVSLTTSLAAPPPPPSPPGCLHTTAIPPSLRFLLLSCFLLCRSPTAPAALQILLYGLMRAIKPAKRMNRAAHRMPQFARRSPRQAPCGLCYGYVATLAGCYFIVPGYYKVVPSRQYEFVTLLGRKLLH
jgi:hypothetical protein